MEYTVKQLQNQLGSTCYMMYEQLNDFIMDNYNVNQIWGKGGKRSEKNSRKQNRIFHFKYEISINVQSHYMMENG